MILASKSHPTYSRAILDGPKSTYGLDIETPPKVQGDGTVPWTDTQPPSCMRFGEHYNLLSSGVKCKVVESVLDHMGIVNDPQLRTIVTKLQERVTPSPRILKLSKL